MIELSKVELVSVNGGQELPHVSSDAAVQFGYNLGYRCGRAIGKTFRTCGTIFKDIRSWF